MNYLEIIKDSFATFWNHKKLWILGIILALVGQGDYRFSVNFQQSSPFPQPTAEGELPDIPNPFENPYVQSFLDNPIPYIVGFVLFAWVWWIIVVFIGWFTKGGLIGMVDEIDQAEQTSLRTGWRVGKRRVVPLFLINLLLGLPQFILFLPVLIWGIWLFLQLFDIFGPAFTTGQMPPELEIEAKFSPLLPYIFGGLACFIPLICFGTVLSWALDILSKITARSCVLEDLGPIDSLKRGWAMMWGNIGYSVLHWVLLAVVQFIYGFAAALPALFLLIPMGIAFADGIWTTFSIVAVILLGIYYLIAGIGFGGILNSLNETTWTKLYKGFLLKERQGG